MNFELISKVTEKDLAEVVIANSATVAKGDAITYTTSFGTRAINTTAKVLGVVVGFRQNGAIVGKDSVVAAADNQTVAQIAAVYVPLSPAYEFKGKLSANAGTTAGSGTFGYFTLAASGGALTESTYSAGTVSHFASTGTRNGVLTHVYGHFDCTKTF